MIVVFRLDKVNGDKYLNHSKDEDEMIKWYYKEFFDEPVDEEPKKKKRNSIYGDPNIIAKASNTMDKGFKRTLQPGGIQILYAEMQKNGFFWIKDSKQFCRFVIVDIDRDSMTLNDDYYSYRDDAIRILRQGKIDSILS